MWSKKKEQPQRAAVKVKSGDAFKVISVPIGELPVTLAMVVLPPPGILWSSNRVEGYDRLRVVVRGIQNDFQRRIDKAGQGKPVRLEQEAMNPGFHRMLAKIAHSYAMACIADIGGFQPLLLDIILRNDGAGLYGRLHSVICLLQHAYVSGSGRSRVASARLNTAKPWDRRAAWTCPSRVSLRSTRATCSAPPRPQA